MNNVQSARSYGLRNMPVVVENVPNNVRRINFKAGEDQFVRQDRDGRQTRPAILQQQRMVQQDPMIRMMEQQQKEQKKAKAKQNLSWGIGIASGLAIIAMVAMQLKAMKGGLPDVAGFKMGNLEFLSFKDNKKIFDLKNSKSLHPDVRKFFTEMAEIESIPENIAKRAGTFGEAGTNSVILFGNSGVGKTELIKAYAKYVDAEYVAISLADFANSYTNGTAINIKAMFDAIAARAKSNPKKQIVVSIDEIDAIIQRATGSGAEELSKNRQSLINSLDKILDIPNIKIFGSSNADIHSLDGATIRRFGHNFTVPMPDKTQLKEALKFQLQGCEGAMENNGKFFEGNAKLDEFLDKLVERKCAFGDIKNIVKSARNSYALDMNRNNKPTKEFSVKYLSDALKNIETTAGEMAERLGTAK